MKQSKNFAEVVKNTLESLDEAIGAGSYQPAGLSTVSTNSLNPSSRAGNPPYSTYSDRTSRTTPGDKDYIDNSQPEEELKAPKHPPYPLETVVDHIVNSYESLSNVNMEIELVFKNPVLTKAQTDKLRLEQQRVKTTLGNIKKIYTELQKITL